MVKEATYTGVVDQNIEPSLLLHKQFCSIRDVLEALQIEVEEVDIESLCWVEGFQISDGAR